MTAHKKALAIAAMALQILLTGSGSAWAGRTVALRGSQVTVPAGGYLYCVVSADSRRPVNVTSVTLRDANSAVVDAAPISTSTFRAGSGPYFLEQRVAFAGDTTSDVVASCDATIDGNVMDSQLQVCGCRFNEPCPPCTN